MDTIASVEVAGSEVVAATGDITAAEVGAIVNAANRHLQHGGGVAAAIAVAGGPRIQEESDAWVAEHGPLDDGVAAVTTGGDLPADHVVHVAGPVHDPDRDDNESRLRAAVRAALDAAEEVSAGSVAFPAISAGIYGYPLAEATGILASETVRWLQEHAGKIGSVWLVGFDRQAGEAFADGLRTATDEGQTSE